MSNLLLEASDVNTPPERLEELAYESIELTRAVAKNPCAPPDLLETLIYVRQDKEVHKNITLNPNTPPDELLELGAEFPRELINNPVFTLLLLENPSLFYEMPIETAMSILALDDVPEEYFMMAVNYENDDVLNIIANNTKAPLKALVEIIENTDEEDKAYLSAIFHVNHNLDEVDIGEDLLNDAIQNFSFLCRIEEKEEFLYNLGIVPEKLLPSLPLNTRIQIVTNSQTPIHIKELLDETFNLELEIDLALASDPGTPIETLIALSNCQCLQVEKALAENPSTPISILKKLACERTIEIYESISRNYIINNSVLKLTCKNEKIAEIVQNNYKTKKIKDILRLLLNNHKKLEFYDRFIHFDNVTCQKFCVYLTLEDNVPDSVFKKL